MQYIDEATSFTLKLSTGKGVPEALSNMTMNRGDEGEIYDALVGCEWDAEDFAHILNRNSRYLTTRDWEPVRTLPRSLVVRGKDPYGNTDILRLMLSSDEPDAYEGYTLSFTLTNRSRVPLALSNMVASGYDVEDFKDYMYDVAEEWDAEIFADAANLARQEGVIYEHDWKAKWTREDKCCIEGVDGFGNVHMLIIKAV